ncbi:DUF6107 family protein [Pseudorhizobium sp. NPDC055634]
MTDLGNEAGVLAVKAAGAAAGAGVSLIYLLPKSRQEAASRFFTGLCCGLIFGKPAGLWLSENMGIADDLTGLEISLTGSAASSLLAWWVLGALVRVAGRWGKRAG